VDFADLCGNDELLGLPVITHFYVDPSVGRGYYDRYSARNGSYVSARVKPVNGRICAAIRKENGFTKVQGGAAITGQYTRLLRAWPRSLESPVWLSVYACKPQSTVLTGLSAVW
jgi:hypothetical protein